VTDRLSEFGLQIRILREKQQLTLEALAKRAGMDAAALGLIERGERNPTLLTLYKIAEGLRVPVQDLFGARK